MLDGRIVLEVGICDKADRRILAEVVLVHKRIVVRDRLNVGALAALEPSCLTFFERV
jgi:hypothetical protein